jgi:hypothetical protein
MAYQLLATPDKTRPAQTEVMNLVLNIPPLRLAARDCDRQLSLHDRTSTATTGP